MKILYHITLIFIVYFYRILAFFIRRKKQKKENSILYLSGLYPGNSGYHWRAYKWTEEFRKENLTVDIFHCLDEKEFRDYSNNPVLFLIRSIHRRFWQIVKAREYQTVIVRREIVLFNNYGNLFLEKLLRKLCPNIILDFDDDLAASKKQPYKVNSLYGKIMLENGNSFRESFRYYDKFIVASSYLKNYVLKHGNVKESQICIIPTCVDYDQYSPKIYDNTKEKINLGWIGGDHNYPLLQNIIPLLNELSKEHKFQLIVIGGNAFQAEANFTIINKKWSLETEVQDLYNIDIGLMPLEDCERDKGKGGFKLIQYMGLGIIGVAQNITVNAEICENKIDSFLFDTNDELRDVLTQIFKKEISLEEIGGKAREKIEKEFTFTANLANYLNFLR